MYNWMLIGDIVKRWFTLLLSSLCIGFVVLVFVRVDCATEEVTAPLKITELSE